jgi:hypothetical protein
MAFSTKESDMTPLAIYTESYGEHAYSVCKEETGDRYFLMVDDQPYEEGGAVFYGTFAEVSAKLEEVKLAGAQS